MGGYGCRMLFWIGIACVNAYITYIYWNRPKRRSIYKNVKKSVTITEKKYKTALIMGSKNAGKTSLVNQIYIANQYNKYGIVQPKSTADIFTVLEDGSKRYLVYELPGIDDIMPTWPYYCLFFSHDLIIFMIDSSEVDKVNAAAKLLKRLLDDQRIDKTPILVVANKQDHRNALRTEQIKEILNLPSIIVSRHKIEVIGCQTKPLPELPQKAYESQYHSSIIDVQHKIFSMVAYK